MIDLIPNDEQQAIADGVAAYLRDALPLERFREARHGAVDAKWSTLAELGCFGISVPEAAGGLGLGAAEDVLVFREFGRRLISPAAVSTRLAALVAAEAGDAALCADLLGGARRAGLAHPTGEAGWQLFDVGAGDLAVTTDGGAVRLFAPQAVVARSAAIGLDGTVALARGRLSGAPLLESRTPAIVLSAPLLGAAMLCGLLEITRDLAADYAKTRVQFGKPIGVFQGIKHRCANMALAAEQAWSQTAYAALMLDAGAPDAAFQVAAAKMVAGEGALDAARSNVQVHGGMGFTDEVDAQLLVKRAHLLHELFQDPRAAPRALLDLPLNV
jgi:alkylation response protein AidB-like acyl-CoA dehydrogenase